MRLQEECDAQGLPFEVGDRVKAIRHKLIDRSGGTGTVQEAGNWHEELERTCLRVEFDSMPGRLFCMAASELVYERK